MVSCNTHSLFTANLEVRNAHLPELNGYFQGKQEPSNKAVTPYNGINRVSESITTTSNIGMFILTLVSKVNNNKVDVYLSQLFVPRYIVFSSGS